MKRTSRVLGVFLCFIILSALVLPTSVFAAKNSFIDVSSAEDGYFTVEYSNGNPVKMKVGVTCSSGTAYYDYTHGEKASYAFTEGNGSYTITLFSNIGGNSYTVVETKTASVVLKDTFAPYLASTAEISFSENDSVGTKAAELCADITDDSAKVVAVYNYMTANMTYDDDFAAKVNSGAVKNYTPDTNKILENRKGICYDFASLFAAMCRSQGIPTAIQRGYLNGAYHAWNLVYVNGAWQSVDMTVSISRSASANSFADCLTGALEGYVYSY